MALSHTTIHFFEQMTEIWVIRCLQKFHVLDHLPLQDEDGIAINELAQRANVDKGTLKRMLDMLVTRSFVVSSEGTYRNSQQSAGYRMKGEVGKLFEEYVDQELTLGCRWLLGRIRSRGRAELSKIEDILEYLFGNSEKWLQLTKNSYSPCWCDVRHRLETTRTAWMIRFLQYYDVFGQLSRAGGNSMDIDMLRSRVKLHTTTLQRILSALARQGIVTSDDSVSFRNTESSFGLRHGHASGSFLCMHFDRNMAVGLIWMSDVSGNSRLEAPNTCDNSFARHIGSDLRLPVFQWMATSLGSDFEEYMKLLSALDGIYPNLVYDFDTAFQRCSREASRTAIVDIGGGSGSFLASIIAQYPNIAPRAILEDINPSVARKTLPQVVETRKSDFFRGSTVQGAYIYHIRLCLHDYDDDQAVEILSHLETSLSSDSVLLIAENILPDVPHAGAYGYHLDCAMLNYGGRERTQSEFVDLLERSGLCLKKVYLSPIAPFGTLEAMLPVEKRLRQEPYN